MELEGQIENLAVQHKKLEEIIASELDPARMGRSPDRGPQKTKTPK